jgi:hypothetical protein
MANLRFLYNTIFDSATLTTAMGGSDIDSNDPLENLQDRDRTEVCRSTGTGNVKIRVTLDEDEIVGGGAFATHNLNADTPVIVNVYSDAFSTLTLSNEFEAIGAIVGLGEVPLGFYSLGGYPTARDLALLPEMVSSFWLSELVQSKYFEFDIQKGEGVSNEFHLGRIVLGDYWELEVNPDWGLKVGRVDPSLNFYSKGGTPLSRKRKKYYAARFSVSHLTDGEVFGQLMRLTEYAGVTEDIVLQIDDQDNKRQRFTTIYGRLEKTNLPSLNYIDKNAITFEFRESL